MGETTVVTTESPDPGTGEVAAAAVGAATIAGAAAAVSQQAKEDAQRAEAQAAEANRRAAEANVNAALAPSREEVEAIARATTEAYLIELAARAPAEPEVEVETTTTEPVAEEVTPPSVTKANADGKGKTRFLDRWVGKE